jgi:hypothetical protein
MTRLDDRPTGERWRQTATKAAAVLAVVTSLVWLVPVRAQTPGPPRTYTCYWTHDGTNADDSYRILVDGVVAVDSVALSACAVAGTVRTCQSPLTMTTNVNHVVTVQALNIFGEASAPPFAANPPKPPAGVGVK